MYTDLYGRRWYKGNLHTHTTRSDGRLPFDEAVARYRYAGYDFLSITDHWVVSETVNRGDFLLLAGCEYDTAYHELRDASPRTTVIHINGIGFTSPPKLESSPELRGQGIIDAIRTAGGIAIINHPEWSRNLIADIKDLKGLAGIEIFNTLCGYVVNWHYDYSGFHVDQLALAGMNLPAFAADDAHGYTGEETRSFIMVQAESLTEKDIMGAIREGRFFASQGPWIQTELTGRRLRITCTPVREIRIYSNALGGWYLRQEHLFTGVEYTLPDEVFYYRIEIVDEKGNRAWTSPAAI